jgi:hypothetical protein
LDKKWLFTQHTPPNPQTAHPLIDLNIFQQMQKPYTLLEFNLLSKGKKLAYLWDECHIIMSRFEGTYRVNLYACKNFYAEVWYRYGINKIQKIGSFNSVAYLYPYLDQIDISTLIKSA